MADERRAAGPGMATEQRRRRAYATPILRQFGRLHLLTQGNNGTVPDQGVNMTMMGNQPSDRRVKEQIVRIGAHPAGFGLYLFDYKPEFQEKFGRGRRWGVMADEVQAIVPQAVEVGDDGYKRVDYSVLGMELALH